MADAWFLLFHGGECDMRKLAGPVDMPPHDNLACKGNVYSVYRVGETEYVALLPSADPPPPYVPPAAAPAVRADAGILSAWHGFARAVNNDVPTAVLKVKDVRNRIRAAGRRR